jgi:hypothetical protein
VRIVARGTPTPAQHVALRRMARALRHPSRPDLWTRAAGVVVVAVVVVAALGAGALLAGLLAPPATRGRPSGSRTTSR